MAWPPGIHIELPPLAASAVVHEGRTRVLVTLTRAEAVELHRLLVAVLWAGSPGYEAHADKERGSPQSGDGT
jgi:hypothetical protein